MRKELGIDRESSGKKIRMGKKLWENGVEYLEDIVFIKFRCGPCVYLFIQPVFYYFFLNLLEIY